MTVAMNTRALCLLVSMAGALAGCVDKPALPPSDLCVPGPIADGDPCNTTARCVTGNDDCATAEVCVCDLSRKEFDCAPIDTSAPCDGISDAMCAIEGIHGCDAYPTSGVRYCQDGVWVAEYSCPDGCPGPESGPPANGDPCVVVAGEVCPYGTTECECVAGSFRCCDPAPCL